MHLWQQIQEPWSQNSTFFLILTLTKKTLTTIWWLHVEVEQTVWVLLVPFTTFYLICQGLIRYWTFWLVDVLLFSASFPLSSLFSSPRYFFPSSRSLWGFSLQQVAGRSAEASLTVWHHGNRHWKQHLHACAQTNVNMNTGKCTLACQKKDHERGYKLGYPCAHGSKLGPHTHSYKHAHSCCLSRVIFLIPHVVATFF